MVRKNKQTQGELIYGIHPLIEVLKAKRRKVISIYTTKPVPKQWREIERVMPKYPIPIQYVSRDVLANMSGTTEHQSVVAWVQTFPFRNKNFEPKNQPFIIMLDSIQDPRNLGAIVRSAYCAGASGVVMTTKNSAPLNAVAIKSSAGLAEHLEIQQVSSAQEGLQMLSNLGYSIYLAMLNGRDAMKESYDLPTCIVIGNEAIGIAKQLQKYGTPVTLPQKTADVSYNASVAAGILLFMIGTKHKLI
ncbi:MAG TPA: RNA methyltransferase [Candidatus Babeliales bacterium]|nr:RNA methyltransferase [Candidatus Babeliales bacterium]